MNKNSGVGELLGNATAGFFAGAAAGGAVASTIMGGDPGIGALYAVAAASLAYSFPQVRAEIAKFQKYLDSKTRVSTQQLATRVSETGPPIKGWCIADYCEGVRGSLTLSEGGGGILTFSEDPKMITSRPIVGEIFWSRNNSGAINWRSWGLGQAPAGHEQVGIFALEAPYYMNHTQTVPYGNGYYKVFLRMWDYNPIVNDWKGGGTLRFCASAC